MLKVFCIDCRVGLEPNVPSTVKVSRLLQQGPKSLGSQEYLQGTKLVLFYIFSIKTTLFKINTIIFLVNVQDHRCSVQTALLKT